MAYDFDRIINRCGTDSLKWQACHGNDMLPLWVADMDFASPPGVVRALRQRVDHEVFGYSVAVEEVNQAVITWAASHYDWQINSDWIVWLPGLVPGLHLACLAYAAAGEEVLTYVPVYPPFLSAPRVTGRVLKTIPLSCEQGRWCLDLDALASAATGSAKLLLLCHPHNPVGRALCRDELAALAEVCQRHDLVVCSDEIHCDLMLEPRRHIPLASLGDDIANRTVTLMSPAKTFNTPGLNCGLAVIPNASLRRRFQRAARGLVPHPGALGYAACRAAYAEGEDWRVELLEYLRGNRLQLETFLAERLPMFQMSSVEATYLAWLDTRWLGMRNNVQFFEAAGVKLSDGAMFQGHGFMRLNFGCPLATLLEALERIHRAVSRVT
ncbi:MAG: MalY/PatB family protein [Pirellulaceae bacterium]